MFKHFTDYPVKYITKLLTTNWTQSTFSRSNRISSKLCYWLPEVLEDITFKNLDQVLIYMTWAIRLPDFNSFNELFTGIWSSQTFSFTFIFQIFLKFYIESSFGTDLSYLKAKRTWFIYSLEHSSSFRRFINLTLAVTRLSLES